MSTKNKSKQNFEKQNMWISKQNSKSIPQQQRTKMTGTIWLFLKVINLDDWQVSKYASVDVSISLTKRSYNYNEFNIFEIN